jgi:hypothetical protein
MFPNLITQAYKGDSASLKEMLGSKVKLGKVKHGAVSIMRSAANHFFLDMEVRAKWIWSDNAMTLGTGSPFLSSTVTLCPNHS